MQPWLPALGVPVLSSRTGVMYVLVGHAEYCMHFDHTTRAPSAYNMYVCYTITVAHVIKHIIAHVTTHVSGRGRVKLTYYGIPRTYVLVLPRTRTGTRTKYR